MKKIIFCLLLGIALISLASAEVNPCGKDNSFLGCRKNSENVSLYQQCDSCSYVNISSITYPNGTILPLEEVMTRTGVDYNYSFQPPTQGCYSYSVYGDKDSGYESEIIDFKVTTTGLCSNEAGTTALSRGIYFLFGIAVILLTAFFFIKSKPPVKWTLFLLSFIFLLASLNILFVGIQDEVVNPQAEQFFDILTASSWYLLWFAAIMLGVLWIITTIQTLLVKNVQNKLEKYG